MRETRKRPRRRGLPISASPPIRPNLTTGAPRTRFCCQTQLGVSGIIIHRWPDILFSSNPRGTQGHAARISKWLFRVTRVFEQSQRLNPPHPAFLHALVGLTGELNITSCRKRYFSKLEVWLHRRCEVESVDGGATENNSCDLSDDNENRFFYILLGRWTTWCGDIGTASGELVFRNKFEGKTEVVTAKIYTHQLGPAPPGRGGRGGGRLLLYISYVGTFRPSGYRFQGHIFVSNRIVTANLLLSSPFNHIIFTDFVWLPSSEMRDNANLCTVCIALNTVMLGPALNRVRNYSTSL